MENMNDFKSFKNLKKGTSLIQEDVIQFGDTLRVRGFDVPMSLISSFKKKAKDSGNDISGKFADNEIAEFITRYVQSNFLTIDNLPMSVLGSEYDKVQVQPAQGQAQMQIQGQAQVQEPVQNAQAQETAAQVPAQEGGQTQGQAQTQGQSTQAPAQGGQTQSQEI